LKKDEIIGGIIGVLISGFVFYESSKFPKDIVMSIGPSYFPKILATALLLVSGILIINAIRGKSKKSAEGFDIKDPGIQRAGVALLATIVYCLVLNYIGFIISSSMFLLFLMYLLKKRNYFKMAAISIGVTLSVYFIFRTLLNITLPSGFLG